MNINTILASLAVLIVAACSSGRAVASPQEFGATKAPSTALSSFGGTYELIILTYNRTGPKGGWSCETSNPLTHSCSCPAGFSASEVSTSTGGDDDHAWEAVLYQCTQTGGTPDGNGIDGLYTIISLTYSSSGPLGGWTCENANPFTKACSCPAGDTASEVATNTGGDDQHTWLSITYQCTKSPRLK